MEGTTWTSECRTPEAYSAYIQCLAAQAPLMMLDIADRVAVGVVALANCLCHWPDRSSVICDGLDVQGITLTFLFYENQLANCALV